MKKLDPNVLKRAAVVLRSISHPQRLRLVECLESKSATVGELASKASLKQVTVSQQLAVLKKAGIVRSEAEANRRVYSIINPSVVHVLDCMRKHGGKS